MVHLLGIADDAVVETGLPDEGDAAQVRKTGDGTFQPADDDGQPTLHVGDLLRGRAGPRSHTRYDVVSVERVHVAPFVRDSVVVDFHDGVHVVGHDNPRRNYRVGVMVLDVTELFVRIFPDGGQYHLRALSRM